MPSMPSFKLVPFWKPGMILHLLRRVLDLGGIAGVWERGFLVSSSPEPIYGGWDVIQIHAGSGSMNYRKGFFFGGWS